MNRIDPSTKDANGRTVLEYLEEYAGEYIDEHKPKKKFAPDDFDWYGEIYDTLEERLEEYEDQF